MGSGETRFDVETTGDPVGDGLEVSEVLVASGSSTCELKQAVDGLDGGGGGVVFEVPEDAVDVFSERSPEFDERLEE